MTCNGSLHVFSFWEADGGHLSDCEPPHRSLHLGIPARELAFHSSFAKRRDRTLRPSRQIGQGRSQLCVRRVR